MKAVDLAVVADAADRPQSQSMSREDAQVVFLRLAEDPAGRRRGADFGPDRDRRQLWDENRRQLWDEFGPDRVRRRLWDENGQIRRRKGAGQGLGLGLLPRLGGIIGVDVGIDEK